MMVEEKDNSSQPDSQPVSPTNFSAMSSQGDLIKHVPHEDHSSELSSPPAYSVASPESASTTDVKSIFTQLDDAGLSWFHIKTVMVAGMGFFCDSYDLFSISLVTSTIGRIYYPNTSYNCVPCDNPASPSSTTCLADNCVKILKALDIVSGSTFNSGFDASGTGWADTRDNEIFGNGIPTGDHYTYQSILSHRPSAMPADTKNALLAVALCGTLVGQLLFGWLGDKIGRKSAFGITLYIMVTACAAQAFSFGSSATAAIATLCFFRFFLGVGIGGDYPLAAVLMSEYAGKKNRGALVAAVFAMQGMGYLVAATFAIIMSTIFRYSPHHSNPDHLWRIILAFGSVPTILTLYARLNLPETPRYTAFVREDATQFVQDMNQVLEAERTGHATPAHIASRDPAAGAVAHRRVHVSAKQTMAQFMSKYWVMLIGTAGSWFLLDIAFYSQNLTQSDVFSSVGWLPDAWTMDIPTEAFRVSRAQAIVALASTVPGYWFTVFTIEYLGRWKIQMGGFLMMTLFMGILAGDYNNLKANNVPAFIAMYCMTFFFANWGPNTTTFVIPSECYPTQYRSWGHGFSAACGKAGAIVGTFGFSIMKDKVSTQAALGLLCGINGLGVLCTFLVPETKGKSLEELGGDQLTEQEGQGEGQTKVVKVV